jgi:phage terminase large subunit GpA-like protein
MRLASLANKAEVWRQVSGALKPPPTKTPDLWTYSGHVLPRGSAEAGRWRSNRTPYMIPIVRACTNPKYRRIIEVPASQMGKPTVY